MNKIIVVVLLVASCYSYAQIISVSKDSMRFVSYSYNNRHRIADSLLIINDGDTTLRINYIESSERLLLFQISLKHNDGSMKTGYTLQSSSIFPITVTAKDTAKIVFMQIQATTKISNTFIDWKDSLTISNNSLNKPLLKVVIWGNTILDIQDEESIPSEVSLSQNYPNPFNPETTISYTIPSNVKCETINVSLKVYDVLGREVATLVNEYKQAGSYTVAFNVKTRYGVSLPSGIYFYQLVTPTTTITKKMCLVK